MVGFCRILRDGRSITTVGRTIAIPLINKLVNGSKFSNVFGIQKLKLAALLSILLKLEKVQTCQLQAHVLS